MVTKTITKTYCDICNKDVEIKTMHIKGGSFTDAAGDTDYVTYEKDLCFSCMRTILQEYVNYAKAQPNNTYHLGMVFRKELME